MLPLSQETDYSSVLNLGPGKSFGTAGSGTNTFTAPVASTDDLKSDALGVIFTAKDFASTPVCRNHYMMVQAGFADSGNTLTTKSQYLQFGSKAAAVSFEALVAPTQAADPKIPSTGASMLAAGAASLAVAMTLF